jgi:hypothetical protein
VIFMRLKAFFFVTWEKLNRSWASAGAMQEEIERAKAEQLFKYENVRWHL